MDWLSPMAPLIFTPNARCFLALALLQEENERVMPSEEDQAASDILGLLVDLGLLELKAGGYVATEFLRMQSWAEELKQQPFPDR